MITQEVLEILLVEMKKRRDTAKEFGRKERANNFQEAADLVSKTIEHVSLRF